MFRTGALAFLFLALCLGLLPDSWLFAQTRNFRKINRVPVYRSKHDSVRLFEIEKQLRSALNTGKANVITIDSLVALFQKQSAYAIIGHRNIYLPAADHIPLDSLQGITDLSAVSRVSIHDYQSEEFPSILLECKNLESLELVNTAIRLLPKDLNNLTKLNTISIYNPLTKRRIRLKKNDHVSTLVIRGEHPRNLPRRYRPYTALENLDLSGNSLKRFPNGARRNKNLRDLNLQNNQITLSGRLKKHRNIETLAFQHNEINRVPRSIRRFPNLKKLTFNHNRITSVHPAISKLNKIEILSFYHNALTAIPSGVYELEKLREIDLFYNAIEQVEPQLHKWKNLEMLYLSHNRLHTLPETIGQLSALKGLYVRDNLLDQLPDGIGDLTKLRYLWVNNNNLRQLPHALYQLKNLEELDLSQNFLEDIEETVFDLKFLKILSLLDNPWRKSTLEFIFRRGTELRTRNVFVHLPDQ